MKNIKISDEYINDFCRKWRIKELSLFGSVLRDDFGDESDIDVLVSFYDNAEWNLFDIIDMKYELEAVLNRSVDIIEDGAIRNPYRLKEISRTKEVIYAA